LTKSTDSTHDPFPRFRRFLKGRFRGLRLLFLTALSDGDSRAMEVAMQKFLDADGVECGTLKGNADAAAKHFTKVYNITRERPPGAAEAVARSSRGR
jgi:hypothetical protein